MCDLFERLHKNENLECVGNNANQANTVVVRTAI